MQVKEPKLLAKLLAALYRKGYVSTVGIRRGFKLPRALLDGCGHGPNQAEFQIVKLFPVFPYLKITSVP